jgi:hypothetical protein
MDDNCSTDFVDTPLNRQRCFRTSGIYFYLLPTTYYGYGSQLQHFNTDNLTKVCKSHDWRDLSWALCTTAQAEPKAKHERQRLQKTGHTKTFEPK